MATFLLIIVKPTSPVYLIWMYGIVMGFGGGSWLPILSMLVSTNFGLASYGAIFGAASLLFNLGVSTGPLFAGWVYDSANSYYWAFVIFMILYFCTIPAILLVRRPVAR